MAVSQIQEIGYSVAFTSTSDATVISILVALSFLSFLGVMTLLFVVALSALKARNSSDSALFVKNHVAVYFVCLMICWIIQCMGSALSVQWLQDKAVIFGKVCTVQGIFKHIANVGTAVWTTVIAVHAFFVLFLEMNPSKYVMSAVVPVGWVITSVIVMSGPLFVAQKSHFYGVTGLGCGVAPEFQREGIMLGEMIMIIAAAVGSILCLFTFLRTRGAKDLTTEQLVVQPMLLHPVVFTVFAVPTAIVQVAAASGAHIALEWSVLCNCINLVAGLVSVVIFSTTRRMLARSSDETDWKFVSRTTGTGAEDKAEKGDVKKVTFAAEPTILCTPPAGRQQIKRPRSLDLAFRESWDSMYSVREGQWLPPLSSHWSPDTPPLFGRSRLSAYVDRATIIAQRI